MLSDSEKLERLFELYEKKMYRTAFQILKDVGQAEDAVQDAFLRVMSHLNQIESPESVETKHFMIKVIRSAAIDIYRRNQREKGNVIYDPEDMLKNRKVSNESGIDIVENRHVIQRALLALDEKYREVLELKCYFGLSHREIAVLLEISEDTVANDMSAQKRLQLR